MKRLKRFLRNLLRFRVSDNAETDIACGVTGNIYDSICKVDRFELFERLTLEGVPDVEVIGDLNDGRPVIFIMDDFKHVMSLYEVNLGDEAFEKYNIVKALGHESGFIAYKYIKNHGQIDFAFLDITMTSVIKFNDGETLDIDGVDIAIEINKRSPETKIILPTAHTMNIKIPQMKYYIDKMMNYFKCDEVEVTKYFLDKNGEDTLSHFKTFLGEDKNAD